MEFEARLAGSEHRQAALGGTNLAQSVVTFKILIDKLQ